MENGNKGVRRSEYVSDYVVFDLETTGLNPQTDSIIEISALKVTEGKVCGEYSSLVNPHRHIPDSASAVNHITDAMVADAPDLTEALAGFLDFIGDSVLVGHNIQGFDLKFVAIAAQQLLGKDLGNDYVDTLFLARKCLPRLPHHRLSDVSAYFGISTDGAHRALQDCYMNQQCFECLGRLLQEEMAQAKQLSPCPICGRALVKRTGKYGEFYGCSGYPACKYTKKIRR